MHKDYAIEQYKNLKKQNDFSDLKIIEILCRDEFVDHSKIIGDDKIKSICETMQKSFGYKFNPHSYKKITNNQRFTLAKFLIKNYLTAKQVIINVFGIIEEYFESVQ